MGQASCRTKGEPMTGSKLPEHRIYAVPLSMKKEVSGKGGSKTTGVETDDADMTELEKSFPELKDNAEKADDIVVKTESMEPEELQAVETHEFLHNRGANQAHLRILQCVTDLRLLAPSAYQNKYAKGEFLDDLNKTLAKLGKVEKALQKIVGGENPNEATIPAFMKGDPGRRGRDRAVEGVRGGRLREASGRDALQEAQGAERVGSPEYCALSSPCQAMF